MEKFKFKKYSVNIQQCSFEIIAEDVSIFEFNVRTAVNNEKKDCDFNIIACKTEERQYGFKVVWTTVSNIWEKKEYILECDENIFRYYVRVYGSGNIEKVSYFGSEKNKYETAGYFTPVSPFNGVENRHFTMSESFSLGLGYMVPPPLCYSFFTEGIQTKVGISLEAKPGEYNFDSFDYEFSNADFDFCFCTNYYGYQRADGMFETAHIMGFIGNSDEDILEKYRDYSYIYGYAKKRTGEKYDWWQGPLFCGWGEQCYLNPKEPGTMANETEYGKMCDKLDERGINVTAIIIDDKWQDFFGTALPDEKKWPDMRAFTDEQHKKGRRVLLWFKLWNGEGLTDSEQVQCICRPVGADPTSSIYRNRMKQTIYKLLSSDEGCFNCDGFKIDFANCMPLGKGLSTIEKNVYGIELLKRMFSLFYECAKAAKADALINNSCCNPYFSEVTDQVRLHDYYLGARNSVTELKNRSMIYRAVMNDASIDTDGPNCMSNRDTMRYIEYAAEIGVPDLYFITNDILSKGDWVKVRDIYNRYKKR